jgi:hypothetical protein
MDNINRDNAMKKIIKIISIFVFCSISCFSRKIYTDSTIDTSLNNGNKRNMYGLRFGANLNDSFMDKYIKNSCFFGLEMIIPLSMNRIYLELDENLFRYKKKYAPSSWGGIIDEQILRSEIFASYVITYEKNGFCIGYSFYGLGYTTFKMSSTRFHSFFVPVRLDLEKKISNRIILGLNLIKKIGFLTIMDSHTETGFGFETAWPLAIKVLYNF